MRPEKNREGKRMGQRRKDIERTFFIDFFYLVKEEK
jgi:hypothetical protein